MDNLTSLKAALVLASRTRQADPYDLRNRQEYVEKRKAYIDALTAQKVRVNAGIAASPPTATENERAALDLLLAKETQEFPELPLTPPEPAEAQVSIPSSATDNPNMRMLNALWAYQPEDAVILDTKAVGIDIVPEYLNDDKVSPEAFVQSINVQQAMRKLTDAQAAKLALNKLQKGIPGEWSRSLAFDADPAVHNWPLLRQAFNVRFRPGPSYSDKAEIVRNIKQGDLSPNDFWDRTSTIFERTCDTLINLADRQDNISYRKCREYLRTLFFVIGLEKSICDAVIQAGATNKTELLEAANAAWLTQGRKRKLDLASSVAAVQLQETTQTADEDVNVNAVTTYFRG
ncbi:Hypothetical predicted protein, partial [Paramuricea clavata]